MLAFLIDWGWLAWTFRIQCSEVLFVSNHETNECCAIWIMILCTNFAASTKCCKILSSKVTLSRILKHWKNVNINARANQISFHIKLSFPFYYLNLIWLVFSSLVAVLLLNFLELFLSCVLNHPLNRLFSPLLFWGFALKCSSFPFEESSRSWRCGSMSATCCHWALHFLWRRA